ncbi:RidA family protein [Streptomyces sp. MBT65]|uniref:RidA family protein n=1 Tax=Streptomyces sp. MBT65 TaxID=1488395 RepID=UPI00190D5C43|nr:RidA family protein [Streptomyces sp. MBT65]MBK3576191.1 RidA family protein [Streptomyces sp. MBT65]
MPSPVALNPAELPPLTGMISHGLAVPDLRLIYASGQVAWDEKGQLVGRGDLAAQFTKAYENIDAVLAAGGSSRGKIIKETIHLVGYDTDNSAELIALIAGCRGAGETPPASTCAGVETLFAEGYIVEIEVVATL